MKVNDLIKELKDSEFYAECSSCQAEFKLSKAIIFDGTKPFPQNAIEVQQNLNAELENRKLDLKKRIENATDKRIILTTSTNIGQLLEKVLPTLKDFEWSLPDCRFLGAPIDLITFNGCCKNKIDSISFIEIKTGKTGLKDPQKWVKNAVENKRVSYKVLK